MLKKFLLAVILLGLGCEAGFAETRVVLITTRRGPARELQVSIHSDEKDDQTEKTSLEFAVKKIGKMASWGSDVKVCVVDEGSMMPLERKKLFEAIDANNALSLSSYGPEAPRNIANHFKVDARPGPDVNAYRWQDPLTYLRANADAVAVGEIAEEPVGISGEAGIVHYSIDLKISELLKGKEAGDRRPGGTIKFHTVRAEANANEKHPELQKGKKVIVFLLCNDRQEVYSHIAVESFLSIQRFSKPLADALKK